MSRCLMRAIPGSVPGALSAPLPFTSILSHSVLDRPCLRTITNPRSAVLHAEHTSITGMTDALLDAVETKLRADVEGAWKGLAAMTRMRLEVGLDAIWSFIYIL